MKKVALAAAVAVFLAAAGYGAWRHGLAPREAGWLARLEAAPCAQGQACRHVRDFAAFLPRGDVPKFEQYMANVLRESDVDVRFVFVRGTGGRPIEEAATAIVSDLGIGGRTGDRRGVLLLFDTTARRLKVEVGYGLEGHFPDAFVNYLVRDHARHFFETGDVSLGLRWLLRLLQHRIREAVLGDAFDPRAVDTIRAAELSGGAGVTAALPEAGPAGAPATARRPPDALARMGPRNSPEELFATYLEWLALPSYEPQALFFTAESRNYLAKLPISRAYRQFILFGELGKRYKVVRRGDLAILYFTSTPFTSPHFFVREGGLWHMDIAAEVGNTMEFAGGAYNWGYRGRDDVYSRAFVDLFTQVGAIKRFADGDNRPLPTRGPSR